MFVCVETADRLPYAQFYFTLQTFSVFEIFLIYKEMPELKTYGQDGKFGRNKEMLTFHSINILKV
jgi:hypothetical protein